MSLGEVAHQGFAQRLIQRALSRDRIPHAYLFHGPEGVGKETLARGLGQLLLCGAPVDREIDAQRREIVGLDRLREGCGQCEDCRSVAADTHPDLHIIYRQLGREHPDAEVRKRKALDLGVDVVRHFVINKVGLTPIRGRAKVFVIREAERLNAAAQNALLKTLEEPPGATVIILLAASVDRLLPTTLSRCQLIRFDALPTGFVESGLKKLKPDLETDQVRWYARDSEGSLGRAVEGAEDGLYASNERVLAELRGLAGGQGGAGGSASGELVKRWMEEAKSLGERQRKRDPDISETEATRRGLKQLFRLICTWYADILRAGSGESVGIVNESGARESAAFAGRMDAQQAIDALSRVSRAERQLDLNVHTQLCVETLINDLARIGRGVRVVV